MKPDVSVNTAVFSFSVNVTALNDEQSLVSGTNLN